MSSERGGEALGRAAGLVSPDGLLRLLILEEDGDVALGFEGFPWHTHADILGATTHRGSTDVVGDWVADLVGGQLVVAVLKVGGAVRDTWVTDDPGEDLRRLQPGVHIEFRLWDGSPVQP